MSDITLSPGAALEIRKAQEFLKKFQETGDVRLAMCAHFSIAKAVEIQSPMYGETVNDPDYKK